jgi:hypothetical protein
MEVVSRRFFIFFGFLIVQKYVFSNGLFRARFYDNTSLRRASVLVILPNRVARHKVKQV